MRQGAFAAVKAMISLLAYGLHCMTHRVTPSPGTNRRRFQLVTPSRVASGGVFI
jgi:hypothetical protein